MLCLFKASCCSITATKNRDPRIWKQRFRKLLHVACFVVWFSDQMFCCHHACALRSAKSLIKTRLFCILESISQNWSSLVYKINDFEWCVNRLTVFRIVIFMLRKTSQKTIKAFYSEYLKPKLSATSWVALKI